MGEEAASESAERKERVLTLEEAGTEDMAFTELGLRADPPLRESRRVQLEIQSPNCVFHSVVAFDVGTQHIDLNRFIVIYNCACLFESTMVARRRLCRVS